MAAADDKDPVDDGLGEKVEQLRRILREMESVVIAFSGGCDSTFLTKTASDVLGDKAVALTAASPTYPRGELEEAKVLAKEFGIKHIIVGSNELAIPHFAENTEKRCYYCKNELFKICRGTAGKMNLACVVDASNLDDLKDFRPGRDAAKQLGVRSPLVEANFSKSDIRRASKNLGLRTWDKPSLACLASRFPYGTAITEERLSRIASCEQFLKNLGFSVIRVRYHDETARIEVGEPEITRFLNEEIRSAVTQHFKKAGFHYITLDLQGYRTGSLNEPLGK